MSWEQVKVQQLLSHTSGIPDLVDEEEAVMIADNFDLSWKKVLTIPNDFKAGEEFRYNQTNYFILDNILHLPTRLQRSLIEKYVNKILQLNEVFILLLQLHLMI
jgi:transposase